jgi:putative membrane protein
LLNQIAEDAILAPDKGNPEEKQQQVEQQQHREAMTLIEKKTVINLLEAYAVAVKHYLRGEDGIKYEDLYPLVPFLYSHYPFPAIIPPADLRNRTPNVSRPLYIVASPESTLRVRAAQPISASKKRSATQYSDDLESQWPEEIQPAELPPKHCWRTAFPFPLLYRVWTVIRRDVEEDVGEDQKFHTRQNNVPLAISLYLVRMSYYAWKISRPHFGQRPLTYLHCNPVMSWMNQL